MTGASAGGPPACSDWARSQDLSPIGSAGHYQGYLLVEQPLPWPSDISEVAELADVIELAAAAGLRVQAIARAGAGPADEQSQEVGPSPGPVPPGAMAAGQRRLISYRMTRPGWAGPLSRREGRAGPGDLAEVAAALLGRGAGAGAAAALGPGPGAGPGVVDVLVCTHGRRDTCCGARGMELVRALAEAGLAGPSPAGASPAPAGAGPGPEVRLWRTSHTGGHRFAPTAVVLPSATLWAWADVALLEQVVRGEGPVPGVVSRYRGCATLGPPAHQAVEKGVLAQVGWPLLSSWRRTEDAGGGLVRLVTEVAGTWQAHPAEGRHVPQPECRTPPERAAKQSVEWVVDDLRQVAPA
jgi:hypothetical protein